MMVTKVYRAHQVSTVIEVLEALQDYLERWDEQHPVLQDHVETLVHEDTTGQEASKVHRDCKVSKDHLADMDRMDQREQPEWRVIGGRQAPWVREVWTVPEE